MLASMLPMMMVATKKDGDDATLSKHTQISLFVGGALVVGGYVSWMQQRNIRKKTGGGARASPNRPDDSTKSSQKGAKASTPTLKDIWEAGKSRGSDAEKQKGYSDKPFGSKYYYAHNNPNATGGYKDGLKMEDYRMNGPRLLSKNGMSVQDNDAKVKSNGSEFSEDSNVRNITKYLWDDPGDSNGIATIRIDVLPDKRAGEFLDWKDVALENVSASLAGEGLFVKITTSNSVTFRLKIDKLYGDAADVKCVVKPKRLLIKIIKKKSSFLSFNKNSHNLDAWPQPHRKI